MLLTCHRTNTENKFFPVTEILLINRDKLYCQENILIKGGFLLPLGAGSGNAAMYLR